MSAYTISGLKTEKGDNGMVYKMSLLCDGKKVAGVILVNNLDVKIDAKKVDVFMWWVNIGIERKYEYHLAKGETMVRWMYPDEIEFFKSLEGMKSPSSLEQGIEEQIGILEYFQNLVAREISDRKLKRHCKTKTLFCLKGENPDVVGWRTVKCAFTPEIKAFLLKSYEEQLDVIANERFK